MQPVEGSYGEIELYHDAAAKKFEAVVVPQDMTGKPFIRIGIGGRTFAYTPETEAVGKLEAGKRYAYTITVKANGIDVQAVAYTHLDVYKRQQPCTEEQHRMVSPFGKGTAYPLL